MEKPNCMGNPNLFEAYFTVVSLNPSDCVVENTALRVRPYGSTMQGMPAYVIFPKIQQQRFSHTLPTYMKDVSVSVLKVVLHSPPSPPLHHAVPHLHLFLFIMRSLTSISHVTVGSSSSSSRGAVSGRSEAVSRGTAKTNAQVGDRLHS